MSAEIHRISPDVAIETESQLIPDGWYGVEYVSHSKPWVFLGRHRVSVRLAISDGAHAGTMVEAFYSIRNYNTNTGEFEVPLGRSSNLRRDTEAIFGCATTDLAQLQSLKLRAKVVTTRVDSDGDELVRPYSRASKLRLAK